MQSTCLNVDKKLHHSRSRDRTSPEGGLEKNVRKYQENVWETQSGQIFSLTHAISKLKQGNMTIAACFNKLSTLSNELEVVEEKLEEPESTLQHYRTIRESKKIMRFLLILNESYLCFGSKSWP